jgi:hypothetical protein
MEAAFPGGDGHLQVNARRGPAELSEDLGNPVRGPSGRTGDVHRDAADQQRQKALAGAAIGRIGRLPIAKREPALQLTIDEIGGRRRVQAQLGHGRLGFPWGLLEQQFGPDRVGRRIELDQLLSELAEDEGPLAESKTPDSRYGPKATAIRR